MVEDNTYRILLLLTPAGHWVPTVAHQSTTTHSKTAVKLQSSITGQHFYRLGLNQMRLQAHQLLHDLMRLGYSLRY